MAKRSLGYVELEWLCPNCDTRNPGSRRTCMNCGMPQPDDVEFQQPAQEKLIEDEEKIAQAKQSPDIHCYYCGTRNPATAERCSQCGADLSEGAQRRAGDILGAHRDKAAKPIICPSCGTPNEPDAPDCVQCGASLVKAEPKPKAEPIEAATPTSSTKPQGGLLGRVGIIVAVLAACACIATFFFLSRQTEDVTGTVNDVTWTRTIVIEGLVPVEKEAWRDAIPTEAVIGACTQEVRRTQDEPAPNSQEICGTPYTVDSGTGFGEVVQDCQYQVYDDFCDYTVEEWQTVDEAELRGNDFSPRWPTLSLTPDQREGERSETYRVNFNADGGNYSYSVRDENRFNQFQPGTRWILEVNTFNGVTGVEPAAR